MKRFLITLAALVMAFAMLAGLSEPVYALSQNPVAESMEFQTYRNVSFGSQLKAYSPQNEELSFVVTTQPIKGSLELKE